jgi:hypothetical protein
MNNYETENPNEVMADESATKIFVSTDNRAVIELPHKHNPHL